MSCYNDSCLICKLQVRYFLIGQEVDLVEEKGKRWKRGVRRKISFEMVVETPFFKQLAGNEGSGCGVSKEGLPEGAVVVAFLKEGRLDSAVAGLRVKLSASLLHLPPISIPKTTKILDTFFPCSCVGPARLLLCRSLHWTLAPLTHECWWRNRLRSQVAE